MSDSCPKSIANKLAKKSDQYDNRSMKTGLSRSRGGSVRCASAVLALAFCASAFAADPSKVIVLRPQPQLVTKTTKKMCYTVTGDSRIPQPCDRLAAIPTTAYHMDIYGRRTGR